MEDKLGVDARVGDLDDRADVNVREVSLEERVADRVGLRHTVFLVNTIGSRVHTEVKELLHNKWRNFFKGTNAARVARGDVEATVCQFACVTFIIIILIVFMFYFYSS